MTVATAVRLPVLKLSASHGRLHVGGPAQNIVRSLPGAAWNKRMRCWELSLTLDMLRRIRKVARVSREEMAKYCSPDVLRWATAASKSDTAIKEMHRRLEEGWRQDFPWLDRVGNRDPFEHQRVMATVAACLDGSAFICGTGSGKTRAGIEVISQKFRNRDLDAVLIVCPKGVMKTWERESKTWADNVEIVRLDGAISGRKKFVEEVNLFPLVMCVNYDALHYMEAEFCRLFDRKRCGILFDEMHYIANPNAKMSRAAMEISRHAYWRLGATATPIRKGAENIWSQWYVLDWGQEFGANYVQFRREHFTESFDGFSLDADDGALTDIGLRMRRRGVRYRTEDCIDLPERLYQTITVQMSPEQTRIYRQMEEELIAELTNDPDGNYATAATQLVAILRLTQITSGFVPDQKGELFRIRPNPKLDALDEFVRDQITQKQIIVWAAYTEDIRAICERFADLNPVVIDGSVTDVNDRDRAEEKFRTGETRLFVGNPAAGGVGINLQAGSLAIYYSQRYSLIHRVQSEGRCYRAGSNIHQNVIYVDLICEGTADEVVAQSLAEKKEISEVVTDLKRLMGIT